MVRPATTDASRRPGRPRDARAEAAILEAALDLVREQGFGGVTMDAVAARAEVGRATIYRRWATKEELLYEAACSLDDPELPEPVGELRADLVALHDRLSDHLGGTLTGCLIPELASEAVRTPQMGELLRHLVASRRAPALAIVRAAAERGELDPAVDPEIVIDAIGGALVYRMLLTGGAIDRDTVRRLVDVVLDGASTRD